MIKFIVIVEVAVAIACAMTALWRTEWWDRNGPLVGAIAIGVLAAYFIAAFIVGGADIDLCQSPTN